MYLLPFSILENEVNVVLLIEVDFLSDNKRLNFPRAEMISLLWAMNSRIKRFMQAEKIAKPSKMKKIVNRT
jgi:hypothetical protein